MQITDWTDFGLFTAVARAGTLAGAARETGLSQATLSRRMTALEQRTGRRLFVHGASGYTPTAEGRALLERAKRMEAAARDIAHWSAAQSGPPRVRVSAGTWTSEFLARILTAYWTPDSAWTPEFVSCNLDMDIERREVDIGVRNRRPNHPWLAGRRTGTVQHAVYATSPDITGWIGPSDDTANLPSEAWTVANHGDQMVAVSNDPQIRMALARGSIGRVVLPTFAGDAVPNLVRVSDIIDALTCEEWLVCHQDTRHDPAIRAALDAIAMGLRMHTPLHDARQSPTLTVG
ncbi:LysR family transcriptional regulator [uncultured Tateyamaria sp.]|uniref:LysR family transcriptional regulator n=1 Tax=uncultured Tateyamaria sp. TaxID=455651 RepID=UPI0026154AE1|nr:LysR family transcriptional regulator [uncultured Tateyamaria sp.]